jgi:hypothetical protein
MTDNASSYAEDTDEKPETRRARIACLHQGCLSLIGLFGVVLGLYEVATSNLSGGPRSAWTVFIGLSVVVVGAVFVYWSVHRRTRDAIRRKRLGWWNFITWD